MASWKSFQVTFEEQWPRLKASIEMIMCLKPLSSDQWRDGMLQVYGLCMSIVNPSGHRIYEETEALLKRLVVSRCQEIINSVDLLGKYDSLWNQYREGLSMLTVFLSHVKKTRIVKINNDRFDYESKEEILDIHACGLDLWKKHVIRAMSDKLYLFLSQELIKDRLGNCMNSKVLQGVIKSMLEVAVSDKDSKELYRNVFETRFLSDTREFYRIEVNKEVQNQNCSQYMTMALRWMNEEVIRGNKFLHSSTIPKLRNECLNTMVVHPLEFLKTKFTELIPQEVKSDYQNFYALVKPVENGFDRILSDLERHITQVGCSAMASIAENKPEIFVGTFLEVREKYLNLIKECFDSDSKFIGALDQACVSILKCDEHNIFAGKSAEAVASYCDRLLKKFSKHSGGACTEDELSRAVTVFRYVEDKDVFQNLYSRMLSRRLLHGSEESLFVEEIMITKLEQTCGYDFTRKYHEMFNDASLRKSLNDEFSRFTTETGVKLGLNFDPAILKTASWPLSPNTSFDVPVVLEKCITTFEKFYHSKFIGRRLVWLHHMSNAELKLCYLPKTYFVSMTTSQMTVLLLFEKADKLTYTEMKESTKLEDGRLDKVVRSLTESKLLIEDNHMNDRNTAYYQLNMKFSSKKLKFKIPAAARNDKKADIQEEVQKARESVDDERKHVIEAAIVRVMKARKSLNHNALIEEVIKEVPHYFVPNIAVIKKCIAQLIDREYLARSSETRNVYIYIP